MAFKHGKNAKLLLNEYDLSAFANEGSVAESVETGETTVFGNSAKTYIPGQRDSTLSISGFFDGDANAVDEVVAGILATDPEVITFGSEGLAAGSRVTTMKSLSTSYEISSPVADVVSFSLEAQNTDRIDRGISLLNLAAVNYPGANSASQDNATATSNGGAANLHVTANTANGASTIKIQHSADNATFADLVTFSAVSAAGTTSERATVTGTVNRYLRVNTTIAGSSGSITIHANFARR